jgi:hypothetical protein
MMMKKQLSLFCGSLLLVGCSTEKAPPPLPTPAEAPRVAPVNVPDSNALAKASDSVQASDGVDADTVEAAAIRPVSNIVSRAGPELRIRLLKGQTAILRDDTTAGLRFALPRYAGYLKTIHSHVVHQYQYEGEGIYFVVDDSTGDSTLVYGMPVVSPDGKRFAITSIEGMEGGNPGVIEVWHMVGRKPEQEFSYSTENEPWEPSDAVWRDSVTIDFIKNSGSDPSKPYIKTPGRLTRTATNWVLAESSH